MYILLLFYNCYHLLVVSGCREYIMPTNECGFRKIKKVSKSLKRRRNQRPFSEIRIIGLLKRKTRHNTRMYTISTRSRHGETVVGRENR